MQPEQIVIEGIKVADYPDKDLSVRGIFLHNSNWDVYNLTCKAEIRPIEVEEVQKMLDCRGVRSGYIQYYCETCDEYRTVKFGCKSRICSNCGKPEADKWARKLSQMMFRVPHRHVVLSMPECLWHLFYWNKRLLKILMDTVIEVLNDVFSHVLRKKIRVGAIVILHPYSRDTSWKPHVHLLITEGGFDRKGNFVHKAYIPYRAMRKVWQYKLLTNLKKALPDTVENARFIDMLFKKYREGFYAYLPPESRITSKRMIAKYVGRYVRHPAIANCRIFGYDGDNVTFWYKDNQDVVHFRTMEVFEFIRSLVQHIPEKHFKMIRYYGAYSRGLKGRYAAYLPLRSIAQVKLDEFGVKPHSICPVCKTEMDMLWFRKPGPPRSVSFGERIQDWVAVGARESLRGICRA